jgi:hypothetical protein
MLAAGDVIPDVAVWLGPGERRSLQTLVATRPVLLLFFPFAWSAT